MGTGRSQRHLREFYGVDSAGESDGGTITPPPPVGCAYPLDEDEAGILALGFEFSGKLTMSLGDQTGIYTFQTGLSNGEAYAAVPNGGLSATPLNLGGGKAVEVAFSFWPGIDGATGSGMYLHLVTPMTAVPMLSILREVNGGVESTEVIRDISDSATTLYTHPSGAGVVALRFDGANVRVWMDNVEVPLSDSAWTNTSLIPVLQSFEVAGVPAGDAGKTMSASLRTNAADFATTNMPAGTADPCGNVIGAP